ncbi:response regulator transcription factor [Vibrio sp. JC009]|uniref:response regulator n=1 Tax=Vibrio sp. JC009 TaxID=2912314 RepID=UPI0023AF97F9|nr:response regulator transcription factor [Vibrio sp. JC009]WED23607.1 response regulator transcription factor [Vibrio sp. JC009]
MDNRSNKPILVVDDELDVREMVCDVLSQAGYPCDSVEDGASCRLEMSQRDYHLIIIDLKLRQEDGLELARRIREESEVPILMLTGKGTETDRIISLELAADDFLMKPFNIRELVARVNALLRRSTFSHSRKPQELVEEHDCLSFDGWILNLSTRQLKSAAGESVPLTFGEYSILELLAKHPKRVMSREQILTELHGLEANSFDRTIDVLISRLRNKLEANPKKPKYIRTERGVGYVFAESVKCICS